MKWDLDVRLTKLMNDSMAVLTPSNSKGLLDRHHPEPMSARIGLPALAVLVAVIAGLVGLVEHSRLSGTAARSAPTRIELTAAVGPIRPVEGWIVGLSHAVWDGRESPGLACVNCPRLARRIERELALNPTADLRHARALLDLIAGRAHEAVERLALLAQREPSHPVLWSDLAVAYIERARQNDSPYDLVRGAAAASRALGLDSSLAEAHFNRALALERLTLSGAAVDALESALLHTREEPWKEEISQRLAGLKRGQVARWSEAARQRLYEAALADDRELVAELLSLSPRDARLVLEESLLPGWAEATRARDPDARGRLARGASLLASLYQAHLGDPFYAAAVEVVRPAADPSKAWIQGHLRYRSGRQAYSRAEYGAAAEAFAGAAAALEDAGSPFAWRALFYSGCTALYQGRKEEAVDHLRAVEAEALRRGYRSLLGETLWMLGLTRIESADPEGALVYYQRSRDHFQELGDLENLAGIENLIAETLDLLGSADQAWKHRFAALAATRQIDYPLRRYQIFSVSAVAIHRQGEAALAPLFQQEAVRQARRMDNPVALASAQTWNAKYLRQAGLVPQAARALREADEAVAGIAPGPAQMRARGDLLLEKAELLAASSPRAAIALLSSALRLSHETDHIYHRSQLYRLRGVIYRRLGDLRPAESDLEAGVRELERWATSIDDAELVIRFLDGASAAFEELALLHFDELDDPESALRWTERSRAQVLSKGWPDLGEGLCDGCAWSELPPGHLLIEYEIVGDRLLIWAGDASGLQMAASSRGAVRLGELVTRFRRLAGDPGGVEEWQALGEELYRLLIEPVAAAISPEVTLVIAPDGGLGSLPFAALRPPGGDRYLIDDHALSITPSAAVYRTVRRRSAEGSSAAPAVLRALVLGDPEVAGDLPRLPASREEASQIAALYEEALLLVGREASKAHLLAAAPDHQVLHLAGHALPSPDQPRWSRMLLASAEEDGRGGPLYAHELYGRAWTTPQVAVLAGCSTASGYVSEGSGLESLGQAFLAAGVPSVIATLWAIDDAAVAGRMVELHRRLRRGEAPAAALRGVQRGAREDWPPHWAAFALLGDSGVQRTGGEP